MFVIVQVALIRFLIPGLVAVFRKLDGNLVFPLLETINLKVLLIKSLKCFFLLSLLMIEIGDKKNYLEEGSLLDY